MEKSIRAVRKDNEKFGGCYDDSGASGGLVGGESIANICITGTSSSTRRRAVRCTLTRSKRVEWREQQERSNVNTMAFLALSREKER